MADDEVENAESAPRADALSLDLAPLADGARDDDILLGENADIIGGVGADLFTFSPMLGQSDPPSTVTDFDPEEDAIVIKLDQFYEGPGVASLVPDGDGGMFVEIDGQTAFALKQPVADLSSIVVLQ
jgi:hypothetical protein